MKPNDGKGLPEPRVEMAQSIHRPLPAVAVLDRPVHVRDSTLPPPVIAYAPDSPEGDRWVLMEAYRYQAGRHRIRIPAGFTFDLASTPRVVWSLAAPFDMSIVGPLLHDDLYRHGGVLPRDAVVPYRTWTRAQADALFREIMKREGVSAWRRWAAYTAVRAFGAGSWRGQS